jgi:hypothetical protein
LGSTVIFGRVLRRLSWQGIRATGNAKATDPVCHRAPHYNAVVLLAGSSGTSAVRISAYVTGAANRRCRRASLDKY